MSFVPSVAPPLPLFMIAVDAGFPSPAEQYLDRKLDLHQYLIKRPAATFLMRIRGESMRDLGILDGDLIVVDKSVTPRNGDVVVVSIDGGMTCKVYEKNEDGIRFCAANPQFPPICPNPEQDIRLWGVVLHAITTLRKA